MNCVSVHYMENIRMSKQKIYTKHKIPTPVKGVIFDAIGVWRFANVRVGRMSDTFAGLGEDAKAPSVQKLRLSLKAEAFHQLMGDRFVQFFYRQIFCEYIMQILRVNGVGNGDDDEGHQPAI